MSTFRIICPHYEVYVQITTHYLYFGTNLCVTQVTEETTNKTSSNEETLWEKQDKANQQSISDVPDCVQ